MRLRFWLGFALAAAIALGSATIAIVFHERDRDSFERTRQGEASRSARQAEALAALSVGQLAGAGAFYEAAERIDRRRFQILADSLLESGNLTSTGFIEAVPAGERARFERRHGVEIVERSMLGNFRRADARDTYFPLTFAATSRPVGVSIPYGYDVGVDRYRAVHLLRARDQGRPAATGVLRLPVGGTGINVFRPVYAEDARTTTVAERRAALIGFALGSFTVADLTEAAGAALSPGVEIELRERGRNVAGPELSADGATTAPVRIADRTWLLVVRDPNPPGILLPLMIAVFGISLAALLGALVLIWSRNERMQELQRQASLDPLTGLKNRRRFGEDLRTELARAERRGSPGAVLMLDLDNFKQVNDTLGHQAGDRVIADLAEALRARMRETDTVARLGGDEFGIVLAECSVEEARRVATEIAAAIGRHEPREPGVPPISVSIGIAPFGSGHPDDQDRLLARADAAMYEAKRSGPGEVRICAESVASG